MELDRFQRENQANWNDRVGVHVNSDTYGVPRYTEDPNHVSDIVAFDAPLIGDIGGLSIVHLQCHIGTDTISLARLGAEVTGLDFSEAAIEAARKLSNDCGTAASFVVGNVYDAGAILGRSFDMVYTSVGAINWLADLDRWAAAAAALLDSGGRFYLRDTHPMVWVFEEVDGRLIPYYDYFTPVEEPVTFDLAETYTDGDASSIAHTRTNEWNHSIADVVNALVEQGMLIDRIEEHPGLDWPLTPSWSLEGTQYFPPEELRGKLPQMFSLWAHKS